MFCCPHCNNDLFRVSDDGETMTLICAECDEPVQTVMPFREED